MPRSDIIRLLVGDFAFVAAFFTMFLLVEWCVKRRRPQNNNSPTVTSPSSSPSPAATAALIASVVIEIERLEKIQELGGATVVQEGEGGSADCCAICSEEFVGLKPGSAYAHTTIRRVREKEEGGNKTRLSLFLPAK